MTSPVNIELFKPSVPSLEHYFSYIKQVDQNRNYSNFGPLSTLFKSRLAEKFSLSDPSCIELFSSGTMALIGALEILKKPGRPYCLLPSWTFVATAQAVIAAGLEPIFLDVDDGSMQLDAAIIGAVTEEVLSKTSVVLVVAPFGSPLNLDGFENLKDRFGLEILCDCAAGFESTKDIKFPTVISLHATKTFGIGEGGLLISPSLDLISAVRSYSNFGFEGGRSAKRFGINGKLSEFHCAVGLGALDMWGESRENYYHKSRLYLEAARDLAVTFQSGWGVDWISSTCVVKCPSKEAKASLQAHLDNAGIQHRNWWNQGCHYEPFFKDFKKFGSLENTLKLAEITIGLPFYRDIDPPSIDRIFKTIPMA